MFKIILSGCCGRLGNAICRAAEASGDITVVGGVDMRGKSDSFPVFTSISDCDIHADAIVDCSIHTAAPALLEYAQSRSIPIIIATTGHTEDEYAAMQAASKKTAVLHSKNMSVGINLLLDLVYEAAKKLGDGYDCEIVEAHHSKKLDAPSGTALMLADSVKAAKSDDTVYMLDRHMRREVRAQNEIGIASIRGGTVVGEHEVIFAGDNEVIKISHSAQSRDVFADGILRAVRFIASAPIGMYSMRDVLNTEPESK